MLLHLLEQLHLPHDVARVGLPEDLRQTDRGQPLDGYSLYLSWTRATVSSRVSGLGSGGACARRLLLLM